MSEEFEYSKLQFEEGARIIRYWIECRYKILQFVGYLNAAVLTFGFSQDVLLSKDKAFAGMAISCISILVAFMGLATEYSTASYVWGYFEEMRRFEEKYKAYGKGIFTNSRDIMRDNRFHKFLPVHRAHKIFYVFLCLFWLGLLIYQCVLASI
ncbi:MAG: hypothetical protein JXA82_18305 [Sedimentisphaerales bacterium]|nr:hypothetical protein [Sedimentisphaerales bacterium]